MCVNVIIKLFHRVFMFCQTSDFNHKWMQCQNSLSVAAIGVRMAGSEIHVRFNVILFSIRWELVNGVGRWKEKPFPNYPFSIRICKNHSHTCFEMNSPFKLASWTHWIEFWHWDCRWPKPILHSPCSLNSWTIRCLCGPPSYIEQVSCPFPDQPILASHYPILFCANNLLPSLFVLCYAYIQGYVLIWFSFVFAGFFQSYKVGQELFPLYGVQYFDAASSIDGERIVQVVTPTRNHKGYL